MGQRRYVFTSGGNGMSFTLWSGGDTLLRERVAAINFRPGVDAEEKSAIAEAFAAALANRDPPAERPPHFRSHKKKPEAA